MKQKLDFLYVDTNSWTFEVDVNFVGGREVKNGKELMT